MSAVRDEMYVQADFHGCPYKTWDADQLTAALSQMRIPANTVRDVVNKAKAGHYQLACGLAFEGVHGCACDTGINHPNQVIFIPIHPGMLDFRFCHVVAF